MEISGATYSPAETLRRIRELLPRIMPPGLDEALEQEAAGQVYKAATVEDMFNDILGEGWWRA